MSRASSTNPHLKILLLPISGLRAPCFSYGDERPPPLGVPPSICLAVNTFSVPIVEQVRRNKVACEIAMNKQAGAQPSGVNVRHGEAFPEKPPAFTHGELSLQSTCLT